MMSELRTIRYPAIVFSLFVSAPGSIQTKGTMTPARSYTIGCMT